MLLAHRAIVYCYLELKLGYLKILKLFSIRVNELSERKFCEEKAMDLGSFDISEKPIFE